MAEMHPSMSRLYAATASGDAALSQSDLARKLNTSPQRIKNWESRGISQQGANEAQAVFGVSSTWLLNGDGVPFVHPSSQPARLTGPMLAGASRMAREAVELAGGEWMGAEHSPEEADLLALALGDVLENGLTEVTDADVMRFAKKVNGGRKDAGGSGRENGGAGSDDRATQAGENARPARRRRAGT